MLGIVARKFDRVASISILNLLWIMHFRHLEELSRQSSRAVTMYGPATKPLFLERELERNYSLSIARETSLLHGSSTVAPIIPYQSEFEILFMCTASAHTSNSVRSSASAIIWFTYI